MKMIETTKFQILLNGLNLAGVVESTTDAVEEVPISFIPTSSQDNVPIHPDINQDNAPPSQDNAQRTKKRRASSEAVHSALNATTMKALGPSSQVDRPLVSWADIVAKILVIQGDKVGEELTQLHNRNIELDPILDRESCDTPIRIFTSDEERAHEVLGGILEVERPILRDGNLTNFVN
ncbi:hypothetical protein V6N11_055304 [Hibiscus sabdariffa]|uniref:Uncharacterized protein n=1 Tax=Hibiscus sabdariffa TaxID=183260 RepID=A0ABR2PFA7_9ROSI